MLFNVCSALPVECPIVEPGLYGRTPNFYPFNLNLRIVEVNQVIGYEFLNFGTTFFFEEKIVIACYKYFVSVRLCRKPIQKIFYLGLKASFAEVAGMYKQITRGKANAVMQTMRV
jgi:hypothetical protein